MNLETKIKTAMAYKNMSQKDIADKLGTSAQNFNKKMKRQTFSPDELEKIAEVLGAKYKCYFEFDDGTQI